MTPTNPTAEQLTRRAFGGVSAYVIAWQGQPVGRVAFREDGGDLRCLLTVAGATRPATTSLDVDWLEGATVTDYRMAAGFAALEIKAPPAPDYESDTAHAHRIKQALVSNRPTEPEEPQAKTWQAALRSAGYDVWQAL